MNAAGLAAGEMKRLATLVEEFLQFARPQPLRLARGDLRASAETIVSLLKPEADAAGIQLALAPGDPVLSEVDDEKLKQVLLNLVRNALEASPRGARVGVSVTARDGAAAGLSLNPCTRCADRARGRPEYLRDTRRGCIDMRPIRALPRLAATELRCPAGAVGRCAAQGSPPAANCRRTLP